MSRIRTASLTLKRIVASALQSPRCTVDAIKFLPSVVQGLRYARTAAATRPPERAASGRQEVNPLLDYFNAHTLGPGIWKCDHYFDIYQRHFKKFVGREVHVLEIGVYSGGSLGMWREYFGKGCRIYGVDIEPACMAYKADGIDIFIGDQADRGFWERFRQAVPKVDILIDDGSHDPEHQRITLEEMLPHIQPGGVYLCEDIVGAGQPFAAFVSGLAAQQNACHRMIQAFDAPVIPSAFQVALRSITQYPFVTVIEKHEHSHPDSFVSRKQGTEWQPY